MTNIKVSQLQEQVQPEQGGVTRRSFVGLAAAGLAGAVAVAVAAGSKNPIGRIFGKKSRGGSKSSGGGSMFTPRDPRP